MAILTYVGATASPHPRLRKEVACHDGNAPKEGTAKTTHIAATLNWHLVIGANYILLGQCYPRQDPDQPSPGPPWLGEAQR